MQVFRPESLSIYSEPIGSNRANPYLKPGALGPIGNGGLQVFNSKACSNPTPSVSGPPNEIISEELIQSLIEFKVANKPESAESGSGAGLQPAVPATFNGQSGQFPHVTYSGK